MRKVPVVTAGRLCFYYRCLLLPNIGTYVRSDELAKFTGFPSAQIRRDLSYFGQLGVPGRGYSVSELREKITNILGLTRKWKIALVGVGNLGTALLSYKGFRDHGFEVVAAFDNDRRKIGRVKDKIKVQDMHDIEKTVIREGIKIAIITVPAMSAQDVVDLLVVAGVRAILNFAPVRLKVPSTVDLLNIDMSIELERLSYSLARKQQD